MSVASPGWLFVLLLVPLIWWLHRARGRGELLPVASASLWQQAGTAGYAPRQSEQADPAWRRRAAVVVALTLALAGLGLTTPRARVTVWLDDSLSMMTIEPNGRARWQTGLEQAREAARTAGFAGSQWSALGQPGRLHDLTRAAAVVPRMNEARLPDARWLSRDSEHWLLTDGTDGALASWARDAGVSRVFRVGATTENAAILTLGARPALADAERFDVLMLIANNGKLAAARNLELRAGSGVLWRQSLGLPPGQQLEVRASIPRPTQALIAALSPADGLALDDTARLEANVLARRRIAMSGDCGAGLLRAVRAHPHVEIVSTRPHELAIVCGSGSVKEPSTPLWQILTATKTENLTEPLYWSSFAMQGGLHAPLPARSRRFPATLTAGPQDQALLWHGRIPLAVLASAPSRRLITNIDLTDPLLAAQPEFPLLVATFIDAALGETLLNRVSYVQRERDATRIAPVTQLTASPAGEAPTAPRTNARRTDLSLWLVLVAITFLVWDLWRTLRTRRALFLYADAM